MSGEVLQTLTTLTDFLGMSASLWLAFYLLARGATNRLTFRAFIALFALAFYYLCAYLNTVEPQLDTGQLRTFAIILALTAGHNLTFYLLPGDLQKKSIWIARAIPVFGLVATFLLFAVPPPGTFDPRYISPPPIDNLLIVAPVFQIVTVLAILLNVWLIWKSGFHVHNRSFYLSVVFAVATILYSLIGLLLKQALPRFIPNLLLLSALGLLGYSVMRHQVLLIQRVSSHDLPITALTIFGLSLIYMLVAWQIGLSSLQIALFAILAIATHAWIDLLRETMARILQREKRDVRHELRQLARRTGSREAVRSNLQRGLAILCQNLEASGGFVAILEQGKYRVAATLHSLPPNSILPADETALEEVTRPKGMLRETTRWLAPAYGGGKQVAIVGIGSRKRLKEYTEGDLFWLEDVADQIGGMVFTATQSTDDQPPPAAEQGEELAAAATQAAKAQEYYSVLALKPDSRLIESVEAGLRNLHDYIQLGESELASQLDVQGETHIERGKAVHEILVQMVKSLRPPGDRPREPLPRTWYNYVILNDAYVQDVPDREIMARLYLSERTFYRNRRRAILGVTRALIESEAYV